MTAPVPRARRVALAAALCLGALGVDLISKAWAWENLRHQRPRVVIEGDRKSVV